MYFCRKEFPATAALASAITAEWAEHEKFLQISLGAYDEDFFARLEDVSSHILSLTEGAPERFAADYRWTCNMLREEQFYFVRNKRYRRATLAESIRDVYSDPDFMSRYMNGLLLSQIAWQNHAKAMDIYRARFLPGNKEGYRHLEIGPGHGLFLVFAAQDPRCGSLTAWDISLSSLGKTAACLQKMNVTRPVELREAEICSISPAPRQFDSIMCSEVLEHTEQPHRALANMFQALCPGGRLFLNVPVNSPAPDHIYLWRRPEEVRSMIEDQGFSMDDFIELPPTGKSLEQAYRQNLDISCIAIVRKPE